MSRPYRPHHTDNRQAQPLPSAGGFSIIASFLATAIVAIAPFAFGFAF